MPFTSSSFIRSYLSTDKFLAIQDINSIKKFNLSICRYQKSYVSSNLLYIIFHDDNPVKSYSLDFSSNGDALIALTNLKTAVNSLRINCLEFATSSGSGTSITSITYANYKSGASGNTLIPLSWYDVTDVANALGLGSGLIYRVLVKSSIDSYPEGVLNSSTTNIAIKLNTITNKVIYYYDETNQYKFYNSSFTDNTTTSSSKIEGKDSTLTFANSTGLYLENSTCTLNTCTNVYSRNSLITASNLSSCYFDGITANNLTSSYAGGFSDITVNKTDSIGKKGNNSQTFDSTSTLTYNLVAYSDLINQTITVNESDQNYVLNLDNPFLNANAEFRINLIGIGTNNIAIHNKLDNYLITTVYNSLDSVILIFKWNINTERFYLDSYGAYKTSIAQNRIIITPTANQTIFNLSITNPNNVNLIEVYLNGQKLVMGIDFTFTSPNTITYLNPDNIALETTDEIEVLIF